MSWVLIATGFTGAWTLLFLVRQVYRHFGGIPWIAAYFSPHGGCTDAVVREIGAARREVLVLAYSFSSKPIAQALVDAKARGVRVDIVLDRSNEQETYSDLKFFQEQGLQPLIDAQHAIAHNKVLIIDRRTLITGSFNFTHQAEVDNGENLLIIKGHPELLGHYRANFATHRGHSQPPASKKPTPIQAGHRVAA